MKLNVVVLFGGQSSEHEVSCLSAKTIMEAMDSKKYNLYPVYVAKGWAVEPIQWGCVKVGYGSDSKPDHAGGRSIARRCRREADHLSRAGSNPVEC